jgi:hypothetical protein
MTAHRPARQAQRRLADFSSPAGLGLGQGQGHARASLVLLIEVMGREAQADEGKALALEIV